MVSVSLGALLLFTVILLLGSGVWVAISLFAAGLLTMSLLTSVPTGLVLGSNAWGALSSWTLVPLPLFIWMGEILVRSSLSKDLYTGLAPMLNRLPGGLLHTNVLGCGIFASVSGSSAATTATIGRISIPELMRRGYPEHLVLGSLAGSGTIGLLIPPSIILIVYGASAQVSIGQLFIAGVVPGILLMLLFSSYIASWALLNRTTMPAPEPSISWPERLKHSRRLVPICLLITGVIGSIYGGIATPTEAAALGVAGALLLSAVSRSLTWSNFTEGLFAAMRTSSMIMLILTGAAFLTVAMGYSGIPRQLADWIGGLGMANYQLIIALTLFFVFMGCFLDGISVVVLTTSVILPIVHNAGIDMLWFGIFLVLVVEMAQITPPIGFNLFVIQSLTRKDIVKVAWFAFPFFLILVVMVTFIFLVPQIVTWLPENMIKR